VIAFDGADVQWHSSPNPFETHVYLCFDSRLDGAAGDGFSVPPSPGGDPRRTSHPLATFVQRIRLAKVSPPIQRGYVHLSGWANSPFTAVYERLRREPQWRTFSLPVGHNVIGEAFDDLLEIVLQFA
jgi:hypothetical protein